MLDVVTIGETMVAFAPSDGKSIKNSHNFGKSTAGAESNTAIGLAKLGCRVGWVSKLGTDELGNFVLHEVRGEGVDCQAVIRDAAHPTGLMLKQHRPGSNGGAEVFYYRAGSAASTMTAAELPLDYLAKAKIVHLTGITPALSSDCRGMFDAVFAFAKANNILISFDPNIRLKLWSAAQAKAVLVPYLLRADIVLVGEDEAEMLLGAVGPEQILEVLATGNAKYVAIKQGDKGAIVSDGSQTIQIPPAPVTVVDPVGAGDAFNAGFLCGILQNLTLKECGEIGGIMGAAAVSAHGDTTALPNEHQLGALRNAAASPTQVAFVAR